VSLISAKGWNRAVWLPKLDIGTPILLDRVGIFYLGGYKMKLKNYKSLLVLVVTITIFMGKPSFADIVYLTNGQEIEGLAKQAPEGVWIKGLLFTENEVKSILKKSFKQRAVKKDSWHQGIASFLGFKTAEQIQLEEYEERLSRNAEVIRELDKLYDKEREQARRSTSNALSKARRANQKIKAKERQRKREMETASTLIEDAKRPRKPIKIFNKTLIGKEYTYDSSTGKETSRKIYEMR